MILHCLKMGATNSIRYKNIHKRMCTMYSRTSLSTGIEFLFKKNLFLTNSVTSGIFMALGDLIHQEYQYQIKALPERYDWECAKNMFIVGTVLGAGHHYYYLYLDVIWPKVNMLTVVKKIAADQLVCSPLTIFGFFYGMGYMESKTLEQSTQELKTKFKAVYLGDWMFWPPVQFINFYFLPTQYRVIYINFATMIFDIFLSLMKHFDHKYQLSSPEGYSKSDNP